jgi:hypothetical protein
MRVVVRSMLLIASVVLISTNACAADLPLRIKPVVQRTAPTGSPEARLKQRFERFLQFLRERGL